MGAPTGTPIIGASSSKPYLYTLVCCHGKLNGSYLTILYMLTKLFYLVNSIAQIFILNIFLGFNYNSHGMYVLIDLVKNMFMSSARVHHNQQLKQEADAAAAQFASKLNLNPHMPLTQPPIMGPAVIFDSNDDDLSYQSSSGAGGPGSQIPSLNPNNPFNSAIYADTIYSEAAVNSPLHR